MVLVSYGRHVNILCINILRNDFDAWWTVMNIVHRPRNDIKALEKWLKDRDGVNVKYLCTTELPGYRGLNDIFYRRTPHPKFGNKYVGIYIDNDRQYIFDADLIEKQEFGMIEHNSEWFYSSYRHDFISKGKKSIDGGRDYTRGFGFEHFKVHNGKFKKA